MNKKLTFLTATLLLLIYFTPPVSVMGQTRSTKTEGFETATTSTTYNSTATVTEEQSDCEIGWSIYYGSVSTTSKITGNNSCLMRYYSASSSNLGYAKTTTGIQGLSNITFNAKVTDAGNKMGVWYSTNGETWTAIATDVTLTTSAASKSYDIPNSSTSTTYYIKIGITSASTNKKDLIIDDVVFTYSIAPSYTITAQSNNTTYGTVSLSGSVITGSPNSGYRYASPAYTVSSGTATVSQSGNDFTVTPSSDCTVTINFEAIPTYTVTLGDDNSTLTEASGGAGVTLPSRSALGIYSFAGWSETNVSTETTTAPTLIPAGTYYPTANITLYPIYTRTESGSGTTDVPVSVTVSDYASAHSWGSSSSSGQKSITLDSYVTATCNDGTNSGKYYDDGWRIYQTETGKVTIATTNGTLKSVTFTFTVGNTGTLNYNSSAITSGTAVNVSGTSAEFTVGNSGSATNGQVRISAISVTYTVMGSSTTYYWSSPVTYTITTTVNDSDMGSVSLDGVTITATPNSGYRVIAGAGGYTVTTGTATVVNNGDNTFTVTPTTDCTVRINFELIPTYTLSSAVSPAAAGNVVLGASTGLLEGATATATAAANAGYKFKSWSISGTGATLSSTTDNPTTVTIGTANATVTATFEAVTTYAITYSVNGVTNTVNVEENTAVDLSAPASALIPVGYVFKGWRTATLAETNTDPNDYVTSAESTADITYYAVMALESLNDATWTLDYANESDLSSSTDWGAYGTAYDYTASDGGTWTVKAYKSSGMQINIKKDCSIKVPSCSGNIQSIAITCSAAKAVGFSASDYSGSGTITYLAEGTDATSQTLDLSSQSVTDGYIVPKSGSTSITKIVVTYKSATYSSFRTSVSAVTLSEDVTIAGDLNVSSYTLTIPSGKKLTVTGALTNDNPAHLIIEDGGQLVTDDVVEGTIKKHITAWTTADPVGGWHFISYPLNCDNAGDAATTVTNMIAPIATNYDLYRLNGTTWANYKENEGNTDPGFTLYTGHGYLYANANAIDLVFAGSLNYMSSDFTSLETGWNLVGNPYAYNAYPSMSYYKMNDDGTAIASTEYTTATAVPPCTGILVQNDGSHANITFSKTAPSQSSTGNNGNIQLTLAEQVVNRDGTSTGSVTLDNAIVSFNEGSQLGKFYFGTQNANIYIPQGNEEYAIAYSEGQGEMPVNFKAANNGTYTLTVNPEGVEMAYLHLIDNMTGTEVDLLAEPSYTFEARTTDYESRFRLVFASSASEDANGDNAPFAFVSNGEIVVNGTGTLQVVDVLGRILRTQETSTANSQLSTVNFKPGVYVLRIISGNDVRTQKIVVR